MLVDKEFVKAEPNPHLCLWMDAPERSRARDVPCGQAQQGGLFALHPEQLGLGMEHKILTVPYFNREKTTRKSVLQCQWQGVL